MGWGGWVEKREGEMKNYYRESIPWMWNIYYGGLQWNQESAESWVEDLDSFSIGTIASTIL